MPARGSYFQRALDMFLPFNLAEVRIHLNFIIRGVFDRDSRSDQFLANQVVDEFAQRVDWINLDIRDKCGFGGIASWHEKPLVTIFARLCRNRQNAANVPY